MEGEDSAALQLTTVEEPVITTGVLAMPNEEFAHLHLQPLQDDSWIRHAEMIKIEDLMDTETGEGVKREILKDYIEERERNGVVRTDPILEGMMYQEEFMASYRKEAHENDAVKARSYRERLIEEHRRARAIQNAEM